MTVLPRPTSLDSLEGNTETIRWSFFGDSDLVRGYCYELPLATLSRFYDNFSFHTSSSHNSAYAFFWRTFQPLYLSSTFLILLFYFRSADSSPPLFSPHLLWYSLSQSWFPFSVHSPMVCAWWCCCINTHTCPFCIPSLDLPRNTLDHLRTLGSLSPRPTTEWTLHNPTRTDSWPVVSEPLEPLIVLTIHRTNHLVDNSLTSQNPWLYWLFVVQNTWSTTRWHHRTPRTLDHIDYSSYETLGWQLINTQNHRTSGILDRIDYSSYEPLERLLVDTQNHWTTLGLWPTSPQASRNNILRKQAFQCLVCDPCCLYCHLQNLHLLPDLWCGAPQCILWGRSRNIYPVCQGITQSGYNSFGYFQRMLALWFLWHAHILWYQQSIALLHWTDKHPGWHFGEVWASGFANRFVGHAVL